MAMRRQGPVEPPARERGGMGYKVAKPTELLVKTGWGCNKANQGGVVVSKTTFQWPGQRIRSVDLSPRNYHFTLTNNVSKEMLPFNLPVVFTIGPAMDDMVAFRRYCIRMSGMSDDQLHELLLGIMEGETRVLSAKLSIRELFNDRDAFKATVCDSVQKHLNEFGLLLLNANIAELRDIDANNQYFQQLKRKALEQANTETAVDVAQAVKQRQIGEAKERTEAQIKVAYFEQEMRVRASEAKKDGDIGTAEKEAMAAKQLAIYQSNVLLEQNKCKEDNARSALALANTEFQCKQAAADQQSEYYKRMAVNREEELRATKFAEAAIAAEVAQKQAEGQALAARMRAEGEAQAIKILAEAQLERTKKEAEGQQATATAAAKGLEALLSVDNPELVKFKMALDAGLFEKLADTTAQAVQNLNPKINIWNTGAGGSSGSAGLDTITNLFKSLPPMLEAVEQQTQMKLPSWMPQNVPEASSGAAR